TAGRCASCTLRREAARAGHLDKIREAACFGFRDGRARPRHPERQKGLRVPVEISHSVEAIFTTDILSTGRAPRPGPARVRHLVLCWLPRCAVGTSGRQTLTPRSNASVCATALTSVSGSTGLTR